LILPKVSNFLKGKSKYYNGLKVGKGFKSLVLKMINYFKEDSNKQDKWRKKPI
jgi:hypothetical protein